MMLIVVFKLILEEVKGVDLLVYVVDSSYFEYCM